MTMIDHASAIVPLFGEVAVVCYHLWMYLLPRVDHFLEE